MKVKMLINARNVLVNHGNKVVDPESAYAIAKFVNTVALYEEWLNKESNKLLLKFVDKDSNNEPVVENGTYVFQPNNQTLFSRAMEKLYDKDIGFDGDRLLDYDNVKNLKLNVGEWCVIYPILK